MSDHVRLPDVEMLDGRFDFLVDRSRGKCVVHLGCVDSGLFEERFADGDLLHSRLGAVAQRLWGVDADEAGLAFLQARGYADLIHADLCDPSWTRLLEPGHIDVVIASEVVEHLLEPGSFLRSVQDLLEPERTELIITVPNAFRLTTLRQMLRGVEFVHPDHKYWFSYATLCHLVRSCGLRIDEVYTYTFESWRLRRRVTVEAPSPSEPYVSGGGTRVSSLLRGLPRRLIANLLYRRTSFWADGLVVVARLPRAAP